MLFKQCKLQKDNDEVNKKLTCGGEGIIGRFRQDIIVNHHIFDWEECPGCIDCNMSRKDKTWTKNVKERIYQHMCENAKHINELTRRYREQQRIEEFDKWWGKISGEEKIAYQLSRIADAMEIK